MRRLSASPFLYKQISPDITFAFLLPVGTLQLIAPSMGWKTTGSALSFIIIPFVSGIWFYYIWQGIRRVTLSAIAALVMLAPAWAAECTIERDVLDDALRAAPSCAAAYRLFEACELGAGGDVALGATVQEKCEADFLPRLDGARKSAYRKQLAVCDRKYAKQDGSMYRSFEAFCRAGAARDYSKRYSR